MYKLQQEPKNAPVVVWLQGGPGASSMYGLFLEHGPIIVTKQKTVIPRKYSWNVKHNMIYIDSPAGTGYSFTDNELGYAKNETDVGRDLHTALVQFFKLFPELRENPFFVTGESYGGKYVPALSHAIKDYNIKAEVKINLQGLAMGNGFTDPENQLEYGNYLYQLGLLDAAGREQFHEAEAKAKQLIRDKNFGAAFDLFDVILNSDATKTRSLFTNLTGFTNYFNYLQAESVDDAQYMSEWIQQADVRKAIHVGNATFHAEDKTVEQHLKLDVMQSMAVLVKDLLNHYRVMHYNGQLDIIVAYPLTENYLLNLNWTGAAKYKKAVRKVWKVGEQVAGYSKTVDNLTEVLVRNAGHMVPMDQPKWAWDLITRFTSGKPF